MMTEVVIENLPDEFIVKHRHYHCEMEIEGYEIMNPEQFKKLQTALQSKGNVPLPNTPGHWDSDLPISDLVDAFQVISESQEEVDAFRKIFGCDSIGITDLSASVLETFETYFEELLDGDLLSIEIAEAFLDDPDSIDLSKFRTIDDEAAEILSKRKDWLLDLSGITELSDVAAGSLAKFQNTLDLSGLTELSDAVAQNLSTHKTFLILNGLTELSDAAAEILSKCKGDLYLNGITELSDGVAESLSKHEGNLSLNGLKIFSNTSGHVALAEKLLRNKYLDLNGLEKLSDAVADSLSKHEGSLSLDGLTELSDAAAESLSKHEGNLFLNGLTELSDAAAKSLSKMDPDKIVLSDEIEQIVDRYRVDDEDDDDDWDEEDEDDWEEEEE